MYDAPQAPLTPKEPAPGAKAAFQLGLWSVLLNVLCGCFPVAIPLGIAAIVKHGKAERAAWAEPQRYETPTSTGKVLGIVGLCLTVVAFMVVGIISAIAMPAMLGQREKAYSRMVQIQVAQAAAQVAQVSVEQTTQTGQRVDPEKVVELVLAQEQMRFPAAKNAYNRTVSPFRRGGTPTEDGEVTLEPLAQYTDPQLNQTMPAVIVRGRYKLRGESQTFEKVIPLD